jgi:uncharacterized membrane protein
MTERVNESIVVAADADTIMDFIADFEAYPDWQDDVKAVEVLETDGDGWGTKVRYDVDAGFMGAWVVLDYTYGENEIHWELDSSDKLKVYTGTYTFEDNGDGTTAVHYALEATPKIPVPRRIRDQATRKVVHMALEGVKREVEKS